MLGKRARTALFEAHTVAGLVAGVVLHAIFFFGAIALFHDELATWEDPAQHTRSEVGSFGQALALGLAQLPEGTGSLSLVAPIEDGRSYALWFEDPDTGDWKGLTLDPARGAASPREVHASQFLFALHFLFHPAMPSLELVAGVAACLLLLAIATGLIVHLRQLGPQLGRFRPDSAPRTAIADLHKTLGVLGLPFQAVFALTGAFLVFTPMLLRGYERVVFDGDHARLVAARRSSPAEAKDPAPETDDLDVRIDAAERLVPGLAVAVVNVADLGEEGERLELLGPGGDAFAGEATVTFRADDPGRLAIDGPGYESTFHTVRRYVTGLHYAKHGGRSLRAFYALLALATAATALSGTALFVRRRPSPASTVLAAATEAIATGSVLATAALLLAVRLLPASLPSRGSALELVFAIVLGAVLLDSLAARAPRTTAIRHLVLVGAALVAVPFATLGVSDAGFVGALLARGESAPIVVGVELVLATTGALTLVAAALLARRSLAPRHDRPRTATTFSPTHGELPCSNSSLSS